MPKAKTAPPPPRTAYGPAGAPPQPLARQAAAKSPARNAAVQRAAAVTFAPTKRAAGRHDGEASELLRQPDGSFRLRSLDRGTMAPPSGVYNFVRVHGATRNDAHLYASARLPHAALAQGKPVIYAGTAKLDSGTLEWWSNYSGTYQPIAEFRNQANLPVDKFMPWQKLQLGGTSMQRGTFAERQAKAAPIGAAKPEVPARSASGAPGKRAPETGRPVSSPAAARPTAPARQTPPVPAAARSGKAAASKPG
jgi:hypothetical protein